MKRNIWLVLGVALVAGAAWIVDAEQLSPRASFHERDAQRMAVLLEARAGLQQSVLELRAGLLWSFDPLNRALASLRAAAAEAELVQARGPVYAAAASELALAAAALKNEESALEQYKTDLALLRLSTRYFPQAAEALVRRAEAALQSGAVPTSALALKLATLGALRSDVERYLEQPSREVAERLEAALRSLQALRPLLDEAARADLAVLAGHTQAILDRRERVDRSARLLVRSPVQSHLEAARAAYERAARARAQRLVLLRLAVFGLLLGGMFVFALVIRSVVRDRRQRASYR